MLRSELNGCFSYAVLYYLAETYGFFPADPSGIFTLTMDGNNVVIDSWNVQDKDEPSIETLLTYSAAAVDAFNNQNYVWPSAINASSAIEIFSASDIATINKARCQQFCRIADSTNGRLLCLVGNEWKTISFDP